MSAASLVSLIVASTLAGPAPVQRPDALEPAPTEPAPVEAAPPTTADVPPAAEPTVAEPIEAEPIQPEPVGAAPTEAEPVSEAPAPENPPIAGTSAIVSPDVLRGRIRGTITDTEITGVPMAGVRVLVSCTCLAEPITEVTDVRGRFFVDDLPVGVYTIIADRGGPSSKRVVALAEGDVETLSFEVAPPTTTVELDRRQLEQRRSGMLIAGGGLAAVGGGLLLIASAVENAKHDCKFDQDECASSPRPSFAVGLGVAGGVLAVGGAALVTLGVVRRRRLKAAIAIDDRSAVVSLGGRF